MRPICDEKRIMAKNFQSSRPSYVSKAVPDSLIGYVAPFFPKHRDRIECDGGVFCLMLSCKRQKKIPPLSPRKILPVKGFRSFAQCRKRYHANFGAFFLSCISNCFFHFRGLLVEYCRAAFFLLFPLFRVQFPPMYSRVSPCVQVLYL